MMTDFLPVNSVGLSTTKAERLRRVFVAALLAVVLAGGFAATAGAQAPDENGPVPIAIPDADAPAANEAAPPRRQAIPQTPAEVIDALTWWFVVPFVGASIVAVWFAIERLVVLRRGRVIPRHFVERFLEHLEQEKLDPETALRLCEENGSPVASIFAHGVRKWGKPSVEVEQAIIDGGERQVSQLRNHLRVINGVATVTPLLGLLGTVIGMIQAFNQIANAGATGKSEELAVGIALALLTTAVGLMIAIPSLILYMYFAGKVDSLVMEMDLLAQNVVHLISAEALANKPVPSSRPRRTPARAGVPSKEKETV